MGLVQMELEGAAVGRCCGGEEPFIAAIACNVAVVVKNGTCRATFAHQLEPFIRQKLPSGGKLTALLRCLFFQTTRPSSPRNSLNDESER